LTLLATLALLVGACQNSPTPSGAVPTAPPSSAPVTPSALDACDPAGLVPCDQQVAFLSIPIPDTNLALTWSSQWSPLRTDHPDWDASSLGLGGWSINVLQRYDPTSKVLIGGDGSWRFADPVALPSAGQAVPSYDGSIAYLFDAGGRQVKTVDGRLGTTLLTIAYDAAGRLTSIKGTQGGQPAVLTVKRANDGTPTALVGLDGGTTSLDLDTSGELADLRDPAGNTTVLTWVAGGLVSAETDPMGGTTHFIYDQAGRLAGLTDPDGVAQQWTHAGTSTSDEVTATTTLGHVSTYRTESVADGIRRTYVGPDGATTTETMSADGTRSIALPDGSTRTIGMTPSAVWGLSVPILSPDVTTRSDGTISTTDIAQDLKTAAGLPYTLTGSITTTLNGAASVETFDPASATTTLADPVGRKTVDTFDPDGHLVSAAAPGTAPTTYTYDQNGREASQTVGTGALAETTRWAYDTSTGAIDVTRPDGTKAVIAVDADGRATSDTAPDGSTVVQAFDADGRLTLVQPPGELSFTLGNSAAGRSTAFLPPQVGSDGSIETTSYNGDGQTSEISGLGNRSIKYSYDDAGRVTGWTFDQGSGSATYSSSSGLLAKSSDPDGVTSDYGYAGSILDKLTWSGPLNGSVSISIDPNGRTVGEAVGDSPSLGLTYDLSGDLTGLGGLTLTRDASSGLVTQSVVGDVQTDATYDASDRLVGLRTTVAGKVVDDLEYTLDTFGRIKGVAETGPAGSTTTTYTYDGSDRLASVAVNGVSTETETYDAAGNRTASRTPSGMTKATYDARDRLVTSGAATYAWASDGTLAQRADASGMTKFSFDDLGQLRGVTLADGQAVTYLIDADGRRIGREVAGKLVAGYLYDPAGQVVAETDATGAVTAQFGYDDLGHLALVQRGTSAQRVITDPNGSPRLVIDAQTGAIIDAITYDAWGRITKETAPGTIPFGFAGGLADPGTGLVHFGARDYDPIAGRWISSDPIQFAGQDPDLYRYSASDPVNKSDPSGRCISGPAAFGLGAGLSLLFSGFGGAAVLVAPYGAVPYLPGPCPPPPTPPPGSGGSGSGSPNGNPNGFHCVGIICVGPNGWCVGTINTPCSIGGKPPCDGCSVDDTHVWTGDHVHFDFQAAGEFIAQASPDGSIEIQNRQEPVLGGTQITFNTAVAADVDGDRVGVYADEPAFLVINGSPVAAPDVAEQLPHGGTLERRGGDVTVTWRDGSQLTIMRIANTLNFGFVPSPAVGPSLRGLLGNNDGNPANDLTGRDSVVLARADPAFGTKLYSQFGNSWRVKQSESLFDYQPGESTATFTRPNVPTALVTAGSLPAATQASAKAVCEAAGVRLEPVLDDCILDVGETGDPAFAAGEAVVAAAGPPPVAGQVTPTPGPSSSPTSGGPLTLGQTVSGTIASTSQLDDYTFIATAGEIVYLQGHGTCINGLGWSLLRPEGSQQEAGTACKDLGREVLATAGTYTVRISSDGSATGGYSFTFLPVTAKTTTQVGLGQSISGSVATIGEWHDYTLTATAGQIVYLQAHGSCVNDLGWQLYRPDGSQQDLNQSCDDLGREVLAAPGIYTVRLSSSTAATGAYSFTIVAVPGPTAAQISVGQSVSGTIGSIGAWHDYTFHATPGQVVTIQATGACVTDMAWSLLRPDGTEQDRLNSCTDLGRQVLTAGGTYTIRVFSDRAATGAYSFKLSQAS
jgi:RHS repeat-associated protein